MFAVADERKLRMHNDSATPGPLCAACTQRTFTKKSVVRFAVNERVHSGRTFFLQPIRPSILLGKQSHRVKLRRYREDLYSSD